MIMDNQNNNQIPKKRLTNGMLLFLTWIVGIATFALGVGWLIYDYQTNAEVSYFAIPLIMCVPVIAAVTFRSLFD
jgi:Na+/proline symporter